MLSHTKTTERRRRRLKQQLRALSFAPLMRGSIVDRRVRCGRSHCACASNRRARHRAKYLVVAVEGRTRTLYLRPQDEDWVRRAVAAYHQLWNVINELTTCELVELRRLARERRRARQRRK